MTKYKVGDQLMYSKKRDSVDLKIIFVPPVDGYGMQYYLCTTLSGYWDGAKKMFLSLKSEEVLDECFEIRTQPFIWG